MSEIETPFEGAVRYCVAGLPSEVEVRVLYDAVGWSAYTDAMPALLAGLRGSAHVVTAWSADRLVGLARLVSDGATIAYLQDVLVDPALHRRGIASELVRQVFAPFAEVRQHVLITDADEAQRAFYESLGFRELRADGETGRTDVAPGRAFVRFRRR